MPRKQTGTKVALVRDLNLPSAAKAGQGRGVDGDVDEFVSEHINIPQFETSLGTNRPDLERCQWNFEDFVRYY